MMYEVPELQIACLFISALLLFPSRNLKMQFIKLGNCTGSF